MCVACKNRCNTAIKDSNKEVHLVALTNWLLSKNSPRVTWSAARVAAWYAAKAKATELYAAGMRNTDCV